MPSVRPYHLRTSDKAEKRLDEIIDWLKTISPETAERFIDRLTAEFVLICQRLADGETPLFDSEASIAFARRTYLHRFRTGQGRRRTSAGAWFVYYEIGDADSDGLPDMVYVITVRHAASRPLLEEMLDSENGV